MQADYDKALEERKSKELERDPLAFTDKVLSPTPDKITQLGNRPHLPEHPPVLRPDGV